MLCLYDDVPGVIGRVGTLFGEAGINIARHDRLAQPARRQGADGAHGRLGAVAGARRAIRGEGFDDARVIELGPVATRLARRGPRGSSRDRSRTAPGTSRRSGSAAVRDDALDVACSWPGASRNVVGSARTSSYSSRLAATRCVQLGSAHSQTNSVARPRSAPRSRRCARSRPGTALRSRALFESFTSSPFAVSSPGWKTHECVRGYGSAVERWPEPVARVAAVLQSAAWTRGSRSSRKGRRPRARRQRPSAASRAQIVKSLVFIATAARRSRSFPATGGPTRRRSPPAPAPRHARVARPEEVVAATGFEPGGVAPFPAAGRLAGLIAAELLAHEQRLDRRRLRAPHGRARAARPRAAHASASRGSDIGPTWGYSSRPGTIRRSAPRLKGRAADAGDEEDLDERRAGRLGRRDGPRRHARPALRLWRLRRHPRLRDRARHVRLPPDRSPRAAAPLGAAPLPGASRTRSRSCGPRPGT